MTDGSGLGLGFPGCAGQGEGSGGFWVLGFGGLGVGGLGGLRVWEFRGLGFRGLGCFRVEGRG